MTLEVVEKLGNSGCKEPDAPMMTHIGKQIHKDKSSQCSLDLENQARFISPRVQTAAGIVVARGHELVHLSRLDARLSEVVKYIG